MNKVELFNDHFQNFKVYGIPKAHAKTYEKMLDDYIRMYFDKMMLRKKMKRHEKDNV